MLDVVVVSVPEIKNTYYLSPNSLELGIGDKVVFDSDIGLMTGIILKIYKESKNNLILPLYNIIRKLTDSDEKIIKKNNKIMKNSLIDVKKYSSELNLNMNFISSYLNFDGSQLLIYFISDDRIDFRVLVKKLAQKYKTRIELRQIGVRDKAKKIGGIGPCGLFLCCNSFLTDFNSVSINMAKNQMLALNPSKINGICGRLMCCLGYENDTYSDYKKSLPKLGMMFDTPNGVGKVVELDILNNKYTVDLGEKGLIKCNGDKRND